MKMKRIISLLLVFVMVTALMPLSVFSSTLPVFTAMNEGTAALQSGFNTGSAATVWYGGDGSAWRVIGYDGEGVASEAGTATLLASGNMGHAYFGDGSNGYTNKYDGSTLKARVDGIAAGFSTVEKSAISARTLKKGGYDGENTDCIAGDADLEDQLSWPLSTKEAYALNETLRQADKNWWLRSPGLTAYYAAVVLGDGFVDEIGYGVDDGEFGVRPAFRINLQSVLFTSRAEGGKSSGGGAAGEISEIGEYTGSEWKLTLLDADRDGFTASCDSASGDVWTIKYGGAKTGENEYISAVIVNGEGAITYYGRLCKAQAGSDKTVTVDLSGKMNEGDKLYIFNEQANGDYMTDYASELKEIVKPAVPALSTDLSVFTDGFNTGSAATVWYGGDGSAWRVIGYDGEGVASEAGTMTLLASGNMGLSYFDDGSNGYTNKYDGSTLKARVDGIAAGFSTVEKSAISARTLKKGDLAGEDTDCIAGDADLADQLLWPLSTKEAYALNETLRQADPEHPDSASSYWWLRSPGDTVLDAAIVYGDGYVKQYGYRVYYDEFGVRPAFRINLQSVLFTSRAEGGKTGDGALSPVGGYTGSEWKLTVLDADRDGFTASYAGASGDVWTVKYGGAKTGDNEYISAVIVNGEGEVTYYGRLCKAQAGSDKTATVDLSGKMNEGDKLYVFNEQYNGDKKTDYASTLQEISKPITEYPLWVGGLKVTSANLSGEGWSFEPASNTLTLDNFNYKGKGHRDGDEDYSAIYSAGSDGLTLDLKGTSTVEETGDNDAWLSMGVFTKGKMTVTGDGTINAIGSGGCHNIGIYSIRDIVIDGGTVNAVAEDVTEYDYNSYGFYSNGTITINGGTVKGTGGAAPDGYSGGFFAYYDITVNGGSVTGTGGSARFDSWGFFSYSGNISINELSGEKPTSVVAAGNSRAIESVSVKNSVSGMGWNDASGEGDGTFIPVNTEGTSYDYKKVVFPYVEKYDLWVGGVQVTSANQDNITGEGITGTVKFEGDASGGTLTLTDATITGTNTDDDDRTFNIYSKDGNFALTINSVGNNTVKNAQYSIRMIGALTLTGTTDSSLYVEGTTTAISGYKNLTIDGATVRAKGGLFGLRAQTILTVKGDSSVTATVTKSNDGAVYARDGLVLEDGMEILKPAGGAYADGYIRTSDAADAPTAKEVEIGKPVYFNITVNGGTADKATAKAGETVTITANPATGETAFVGWPDIEGVRYDKADALTTTFSMPAKDLTIEPVYAAILIWDVDDQVYTGEEIRPTVHVELDGVDAAFQENKDYAITYANNTDAGTATLTVTFCDRDTRQPDPNMGIKSKNFTILPADISTATVENIATQCYTGSALTPEPTVTWRGKTLEKDKDYTLSYSDNTAAGRATVTVTGKGNFDKNTHAEGSFMIVAPGTISFSGRVTLEGRPMTDGDVFTFEAAKDGVVIATVQNGASGDIEFPEIVYTLSDVGEHIYKVKQRATDIAGVAIDEREYTVSVIVSYNEGDNALTVTPSDNFSGLYFTNTYDKQIPPEYSVPTGFKAIYGQTLADVALPDGWAWNDAPTTPVGNVGDNTFSATFTPEDTLNYKTVTATLTITVSQATPDSTVPDGLTAVYGQTLADVTLPNGWAWDDPLTTPVGNVGDNAFSATFTPEDTLNYKTVTATLTITVSQATPDSTVPDGLTAIYGQTLADVALPTGWAWDDAPTTPVGNVGDNTFPATFTPEDTENYETVTATLTISVSQATPDVTAPDGLTAIYGQTLGDVTLPTGWAWDDPLTTPVGNVGDNTFSATFTPEDTENYNTVTATLTISVSKATPDVTAPGGLTVIYGQTLADVALPTGWAWDDPLTTPVGNVGDNTFSATFTPEDTENYSSVTATLTITVAKAGTSSVELAEDEKPKAVENLIEEPFEQALVTAPEKLPEGYTGVEYSTDGENWSSEIPTGKEAGTYTVQVRYVGDANHEDFAGETVTVAIVKAVYVFTNDGELTYTKKSDKELTATVIQTGAEDASFEHFAGVYIGETELQKDVDYTVEKGSTVVTILPAALDKLNAGEYTLTVRFTNGEASTKLTVRAANNDDPTSPQTGDNSRIELWIILMTVSAIAATSIFLIGRRKKVFGK